MTLFEMLTVNIPYRSATRMQTITAIAREPRLADGMALPKHRPSVDGSVIDLKYAAARASDGIVPHVCRLLQTIWWAMRKEIAAVGPAAPRRLMHVRSRQTQRGLCCFHKF